MTNIVEIINPLAPIAVEILIVFAAKNNKIETYSGKLLQIKILLLIFAAN
jgi:hypothetical protein